ncbi:MAG: S-adenosylmethionine decarboxylase [Legionellales bacterium]|nr:S-adenosylmethionine decarboxylase [Legionellales bacterium]|tara:strand:+ start:1279 stop:1680 length:402 start_codon:yes stop_codon:yes gene_type:complete
MNSIQTQLDPKASMNQTAPWGQSVAIDCYRCDIARITDADQIKDFTAQLIELIDMKAFGPCHVVHFGEEPRVEGFSMFQLIETSCISAHFANQTAAAYIDIFSCKAFDAATAADFCQTFFKAEAVNVQALTRR